MVLCVRTVRSLVVNTTGGNMPKKRNYKKEYENYQGTEEQKKNRAKRNAARRKATRKGKVTKGDG